MDNTKPRSISRKVGLALPRTGQARFRASGGPIPAEKSHFRIHTHLSLWQPSAARPAFECPEYLDPFALCRPFSCALGGRDATDYYGSAAPPVALATCRPPPSGGAAGGSGVAHTAISPSTVG